MSTTTASAGEMCTSMVGSICISDLVVYISVAAAAIMSVIIMCLQCKIIHLQRLLVRKGIVGSSSERSSQEQRPSTPPALNVENNDPQTNIPIETPEGVSNSATPHSNTTPIRMPNLVENFQQDLEESATAGYDVVKARADYSHSQNPIIGYEDIDKVKKKPTSLTQDNPTGVANTKGVGADVKALFRPPGRLCYEDVEDASRNIGLSSNSLNRTPYEDIETSTFVSRKPSHTISGANRFQIKGTTPQFAVDGDAAQKETKDAESAATTTSNRPEYSVVVKPKKKKKAGYGTDPANSATATYSTVNKPKKKKKSSDDDQVEISVSASGSSQDLLNDNHQEILVERGDADLVPTYDDVKNMDAKGKDDNDDNACYKNVPRSDYIQQPLYSNCREIEDVNDSDTMGDVSSREPAPPPIPIRSYSVGWSETNSVAVNGTDYDIPKELIPLENIELQRMDPVDSFV